MTKIRLLIILLIAGFLSGCGKFENIKIHGMKGMSFRGMKDGTLFLNLNLEIENPNSKKITIKKIYFTAWINERELGKLVNSKKIVLQPKSKELFEVPIEIKLRAATDIFKLVAIKEKILEQLTIEGYIKGCSFPVSKKLRIEKQPFTNLVNAFKDSTEVQDTLKRDEVIQMNH